ncbi:transporter substrate-binding domain-containing protein [Arcobacter sp. LA11]|uniref:transporter substrate-binding domain-containing protein n=1 Tax=Arcobacter sp. LA11 TaxID=1898176 RepID=UPI000934C3D6|nr:transporter substrate-binding domain-containing protein [Arcobacter sp. LA11]
MNKLINNLIILLILSFSVFANDNINLTIEEKKFLKNNSPLRLHNELNWPPYNYYQNDKPKGFSIDYLNLLAKKINTDIKFITGPSWDEFMQMLQNDEIDAIINISKNEQRAKTIAFTSIFHTAANAIYVKNGDEQLDSLEKLEGKTIVMPKGFFAQKAIAKYYPKINQILVKDSLEALKLLSLGKADATIGKKNVIDYVITLNNISGVSPTNYVDDNRMVSLIRIGTSKKKAILRDILEKAQKSVTDEELLSLKRKWFGAREIKEDLFSNFLTKRESNYISKRKIIRMCNINDLKPISFKEDEKLKGITIDILKKIEKLINIRFIPIKTKSWEQSKEYLRTNRCDIIPTVTNSNELIDYAKFTKPYLNYKLAIITQKNKPVVSSLDDILDKTMAKKYDSQLITLLKSTNPDLNILKTKNDRETIEAVSTGKAYFAVEPLPIASYYMSNYALKNLYISRYTNMSYTVNMAVNSNNPILLSILDKTLSQINENEHREIFNKWTAVSFETTFDYTFLWETIFVILVIIAIFSYRQYVLNKHNKTLQLANDEIEEKTIELAKQKILFEKLYDKSSDGVLLIRNNLITSCNESTHNILKYSKSEILYKHLYEISPYRQPNGEISKEKSENMIRETLHKGVSSSEWIFADANNQSIWVEIVLTSIEIEGNRVIHTVIRDISNRKILEQKLEDLNINLEEKIKKEIIKNEKNTKQLIQQSRLAQMGEMISMIAHQWRQPLAAISATTNNLLIKMLIDKKVDKELIENELKLITDYSQHLSSTIDDFRNFFKTEKEKNEFDLELLILKSISIIKTSIESNNIILKTQFNSNLKVFSYSTEIQQVILNILKNAEDILIEKDSDDKKIEITTYKKDDTSVLIKIHDNGGGIENSVIEKIFDPYFSTKDTKDGTGLGLYMSRIIINEHCEGNLRVVNEYDGATFLIELPTNNMDKKNA